MIRVLEDCMLSNFLLSECDVLFKQRFGYSRVFLDESIKKEHGLACYFFMFIKINF